MFKIFIIWYSLINQNKLNIFCCEMLPGITQQNFCDYFHDLGKHKSSWHTLQEHAFLLNEFHLIRYCYLYVGWEIIYYTDRTFESKINCLKISIQKDVPLSNTKSFLIKEPQFIRVLPFLFYYISFIITFVSAKKLVSVKS